MSYYAWNWSKSLCAVVGVLTYNSVQLSSSWTNFLFICLPNVPVYFSYLPFSLYTSAPNEDVLWRHLNSKRINDVQDQVDQDDQHHHHPLFNAQHRFLCVGHTW